MKYTELCAQAEKALEGVTEGPWDANGSAVNTKPDESAVSVCVSMGTRNRREAEANARFIAFTRAWVPAAAAAIRELEAERDAVAEAWEAFKAANTTDDHFAAVERLDALLAAIRKGATP